MADFAIKFKFKGADAVFNNAFMTKENIETMEKDDFAELKKVVEKEYALENMTYEKAKYYMNELRFPYYTVTKIDLATLKNKGIVEEGINGGDQKKKEKTRNFFHFFGIKDVNSVEEDEYNKCQDQIVELSKIIQICGVNSQKWFNKLIYDLLKNMGENDTDYDNSASYTKGGLSSYFWYQHRQYYKENPISFTGFLGSFLDSDGGNIKLAIELHNDLANKTCIKELFIDKLKKVVTIFGSPEEYGFENGILSELKYDIPDEKNKPEGAVGELVTGHEDELKNSGNRIQFFFDIYTDDTALINDKTRALCKLYNIISYSSIYEREIYKAVCARNVKQIIFNGAPGTGKTYGVKKYVEDITKDYKAASRWKIIQFHPSYDYTDFVEGIRPVSVEGEKEMSFVKIDGEFKKFCRLVVTKRLEAVINTCNIPKIEKTLGAEDKNLQTAFSYVVEAFRKEKACKELPLDEQTAGGETPVIEQTAGGETKLSAEEKKAIEIFNAVNAEYEELYYFIIDEINRADISKVFGELMYAFEYRGITNRIPTQYSQLSTTYYKRKEDSKVFSPMGFDCFQDGFFIPENVVIIGTMNDIDKSVESFDFAMRRRFQWSSVKVNDEILKSVLSGMLCKNEKERSEYYPKISIMIEQINEMNNRIVNVGREYGLTEDYYIGPSYFKNCDLSVDEKDILKVLEKEFILMVEPTLREYIRGRANKDKSDGFIKACMTALTVKVKKKNEPANEEGNVG